VPFIEGRFFPSVVHSIENEASRAGFSVIICQSHEDMATEKRNVETLLSAQVAGIMVSMARTTNDFRHFEKVRKRGIPLVFFDRVLEGNNVNAVVLNDREGGYQSTIHLLEQGCRRIAHFAGLQHLNIYRDRRQGYLDALESYGIPHDEELIAYIDMTMDEGAAAMAAMLELPKPPDAVFAAGDNSILGALQLLKSRGYRIPEDIALAGFSNEALTSITEPMLTSVDQRCEEMGEAAVKLFLDLVEAKIPSSFRRVVLQPKLYVRESSLHTK
jgi:LacI family transcriptional regulator